MLKGKKRLLIAGCVLIAIAVMLITYVMLIGFGVINVRTNNLVIRAGTAEKAYDGEALVCEEWFIEHGELKSGHTLIPLFSGSQTTPGQSVNHVTARIVDANDVDVTDEYRIEYLDGTLSVYNPQLKIVSTDFSKEYDGLPLTAPTDGWFLESGTLMMGHQLQVTMTGSQTTVGSSDNTLSVVILTEAGKDVTENYTMEITCGVLEVLPRPVGITSASATWTYDGTPLTAPSYQMVNGTLVEGHQLNCEYSGTQTTVGSCENTLVASIVDAEGNDVTENYTLDIACGVLEVLPRPVTVRSASAKRKYDGNELTAPTAMVIQGTLANGHRLDCKFWGTQTDLGISENFFSVDIKDADGASMLDNYELTTMTGVLAVVEFIPHDDPDADPPVTSPENNSAINGGVPDGSTEVLALQSSVAGPAYLRLQHFGNYNTDNFGWDLAPSLTEDICGTNPLYWLSSALLQSEGELSSMSITWLVDSRGMLTPYYTQTNFSTGVDDSYIPDGRWDYVVDRYAFDVLDTLTGRTSSLTLPDELAAAEAVYREYVYENYLQMPGTEVDAVIWSHIKGHISPSSKTLIQDVAAYIRGVANYNLEAELPPDGMDPIIFFLENKEGVCRHYASTAVLMYRALGVPARYVVGYMANLPENQLVTVTNMQAHAWVEVYIDGLGWIPVEVTGGSGSSNGSGNGAGTGSGSGSISEADRIPLTVKPVAVYGLADGTEYHAVSHRLVGDLQPNHEFVCTYGGSLSVPGTTASYIESYQILDKTTKEDVTRLYDVETLEGIIRVVDKSANQEEPEEPIWLVIKPTDEEEVYSGETLYPQTWEYLPNSGELKEGHTLECTFSGELTAPGAETSYIVSHRVVDQNGNDVTGQYEVTYREGSLKIRPSECYMTVKPRDVLGIADGREWFATDWEYTSESTDKLLPGHTLSCIYEGSLSTAGEVMCTIVGYTVLDAQGQDVTDFYSVVTKPGRIKVQIPISVKPQDVVGVEDGHEWFATDWEYTADTANQLLPGHEMTCTYVGSLATAGKISSRISRYTILDAEGRDVTDIYNVTTEVGMIKVRIPITIKPADVLGYPDGRTWVPTDWEHTADSIGHLRSDHTLYCEYDGAQTEEGETVSTIVSYTILDGLGQDVSDDYSVTTEPGVICVKLTITVKPQDVIGVYNGSLWFADEWEYTADTVNQLLPGHELHCSYEGSLTDAGVVESTITKYWITDADGQDVTNHYNVLILPGTVCVQVHIVIKPQDVYSLTDGTVHTASAWEYAETNEGQLRPGHTLYCEYDGGRIDQGESESYITNFWIRNEQGEDMTSCYIVDTVPGLISVQIQIVIKPVDVQEMYDGNLHGPDDWEYAPRTPHLPANHQIVDVTFGGAVIYPIWPDENIKDDMAYFEASKQFTYITGFRIVDTETGEDVSSLYNVNCREGYVVIQGLDIEITPSNYQAEYDGMTHVASQYTVKAISAINGSTAWLSNYRVEVNLNGSRTEYGKTAITVGTVTVYDADGNDVTAAFGITRKTATMYIYAEKLAFETGSSIKTYDGKALSNSYYSLLSGSLLDGHTLTVELNDAITYEGSVTNTPTVKIVDQNGTDVTDWYYIDTANSRYGTLTVEKARLTVTSGSATAVYVPGQTLTCDTFTVEGDLADGETVTVVITGSQTLPGKSENFMAWRNIKVNRNGVDTTSNYYIEVKAGMLEVTPS